MTPNCSWKREQRGLYQWGLYSVIPVILSLAYGQPKDKGLRLINSDLHCHCDLYSADYVQAGL